MKLKIDREADALYFSLSEATAAESEEVAPGIILDYSESGMVVGIEMLYLSRRAQGIDFQRLLFETVGSAAKEIA